MIVIPALSRWTDSGGRSPAVEHPAKSANRIGKPGVSPGLVTDLQRPG